MEARWGLSGLQGHHAALVAEDNVLWLRFLLVYAVAQAAADGPPVSSRVLNVGDPLEVLRDIRDPLQLAKWALQMAAAQQHSSGAS